MSPCIRLRNGFLCMSNKPVTVRHGGQAYLFEWTSASGWCAINQDGSQRLTPVPKAVWAKVDKLKRGTT